MTDFDLITVSLSRGMGCPVGAIIVGDAKLLEEALPFRKMLGGNMR